VSVICITISGCATPTTISWQKAWDHIVPLEQASAKCDYETSAATQGITPGFRTMLGVELDRQSRKGNLYEKCMNANGWVAAKDYTKGRLF
jgi:hypothetical protein